MKEDPPSARSAPNRASTWRIPFRSGTTAGQHVSNLAFGFARFGLIARRAQANLRMLLRSDTPTHLRSKRQLAGCIDAALHGSVQGPDGVRCRSLKQMGADYGFAPARAQASGSRSLQSAARGRAPNSDRMCWTSG